MTPITWFTLSLLLVLAETVSTEQQCDGNHTNLLLMVDVRHDPSLTVTRIKNIASYFVSKVNVGSIKTLDVSLADPFHRKTMLLLTDVTSLHNLTSAVENFINSEINQSTEFNVLSKISQLSLAVRRSRYFINFVHDNFEPRNHVVVFLASCQEMCEELMFRLNFTIFETNPLLKIIVLLEFSLKKDHKYYNANHVYYYEIKTPLVFIDTRDDFTSYNPVTLDLCGDCAEGWTQYTRTGQKISCYRMKLLDTKISWLTAARMCESESSSLPAIETEDELQFFGEFLQNNTNRTTDTNASTISYGAVINVGLLKSPELRQNLYLWSNLRPFNLEVSFEKSDESMERCIAITFNFRAGNQTDEIHWQTVYCDKTIAKVLVFEMEGRRFHDYFGLMEKMFEALPRRLNGSKDSMLDQLVKLNHLNLNESKGMFSCHDDYGQRVMYGLACDGERDCSNGRDEQYCATSKSKEKNSLMYCVNPNTVGTHPTRIFVPMAARCNMIQDCPDNSDEQGCDGCLGRQCEDRTCVPSHWLSRDHEKCHLFKGTNRNWYLNVSYPSKGQCSGIVNFQNEITFCDVNIKNSPEGQTVHVNRSSDEWSPKCLYLRGSDGRIKGCHNKLHLRDCRTFQCPEGFIKCPDSYCVPVYNFLDERNDCPYGEDEVLTWRMFDEIDNIFKCLKSHIYIHNVHICDGVRQCPYGEDEAFCNMTCPPGFDCSGQAAWVSNHSLTPVINSLNIFDLKTRFLNISGVDLSKLKETFILPNLLEIHASNCNINDIHAIFGQWVPHINTYTVNLSHNKLQVLANYGPLYLLRNLQFLNLSHNTDLSKIYKNAIMSPKLHTLDLSFTNISVLEIVLFEKYKSLRSLNLFKTNIVQIGSLLKFKRLEYFNLQRTSLSPQNITKILKEVSVSTSLYVDNFKYCCPQIVGGDTPQHACHAPPEAFSSCEDLLSDVLKRALLWLVAGVSLAGNIIVVTYRLLYDRGVFKKGYGVFVTNLSVSDCVMGMYLFIIASTDVRYRDEYVLHESDWRHSSLCQAAGFLSTLSSETSTFFVFLITLDRYLVIRFPFGDHRFTKLGLILCVLFVWIIGFILASVPLMYPEWIVFSSNGMCLGLPLGHSQNLGWHYSFGIFICVNFILFNLIVYGQITIFRLILSSQSFRTTNDQSFARRVQEINIAKQLFLVVFSNFLCWFPICVLGFLTLTGHEVSPDTYAWLVVFVMPLNAAINPMIYTIPVMYSKWQGFKRGETNRTRASFNRSTFTETKF